MRAIISIMFIIGTAAAFGLSTVALAFIIAHLF
jgi:hypothetical protein